MGENSMMSVCLCCLSEGLSYKDMSVEYMWLGKREVYSEILRETFAVTIPQVEDSSQSVKICEPCIFRLRDAAEFRKQVVNCEKMYLQHLEPDMSLAFLENDVKVEVVKKEKLDDDADAVEVPVELYDDMFYDDDSDDDDDDPDDISHTRLAKKMAKTASVDLFSLLESSKLARERRRDVKIKAKETPVLRTRTLKSMRLSVRDVEDKRQEVRVDGHQDKHNARMIVKYTTAYPFRLPSNLMVCPYCSEKFEFSSLLRKHMESTHKTFKLSLAFARVANTYAKVDCTDLRCRKCQEKLSNINEAAKHLVEKHCLDVSLTHDIGLFPFKFHEDKKYNCAMCDKNLPGIMELSRHTGSHFEKYPCESCGKCYVTKSSLKVHVLFSHSNGNCICRKCRKPFPSVEAKFKHMQETKKCWPYTCWKCRERFMNYKLKLAHMKEKHGVKKTFPCSECGTEFDSGAKRNRHFRLEHTEGAFMCSCCGIKFDNKREFESHRFVHTKEKLLSCEYCSKSFSRQKSLKQHMWIHMEEKRFECKPCNKKFNQRVSWKTHMKSYHPELVDFDKS